MADRKEELLNMLSDDSLAITGPGDDPFELVDDDASDAEDDAEGGDAEDGGEDDAAAEDDDTEGGDAEGEDAEDEPVAFSEARAMYEARAAEQAAELDKLKLELERTRGVVTVPPAAAPPPPEFEESIRDIFGDPQQQDGAVPGWYQKIQHEQAGRQAAQQRAWFDREIDRVTEQRGVDRARVLGRVYVDPSLTPDQAAIEEAAFVQGIKTEATEAAKTALRKARAKAAPRKMRSAGDGGSPAGESKGRKKDKGKYPGISGTTKFLARILPENLFK